MDGNIWLSGVMGVVVGDALGCPVQFLSRDEIIDRGPITGMEGNGTYDMPEGTWTDDSSLTLATLDSIRDLGSIVLEDIMDRFVDWYEKGEYTPFGEAFDIGNTCSFAIEAYERERDTASCGRTSEHSNGNGALMRILPACLYIYDRKLPVNEAIKTVHEVSGLTHSHLRSKIACGLYYFCVRAIIDGDGSLKERLQNGLDAGFEYYEDDIANRVELSYYGRLRDMAEFAEVTEAGIKSTGYVVDSLEAAIWSLIRTDNFRGCLLTAVNLGDDTDTIGAIAGGLAALYYGYEDIPKDWLDVIQRREWIEGLCDKYTTDVKV